MRLCPWQRLSPIIRPSGSLRSSWRRSPRWDSCCGLFSVLARAICCVWRNIWHERRTAGSLSARKNDRANTGRAVTRPPRLEALDLLSAVLIERYMARKEGLEEKTRRGFSWREAVVEGRGTNGSLIHFQETKPASSR